MVVKTAPVLAARIWMLFKPDDWTVTRPEELLTTRYCLPKNSVDVTGRTTVCVVAPVK